MKTLIFSLFLSLISVLVSAGNNVPSFFRCYYDELNFTQTTILDIEQDSDGYIWLATSSGVFRFDGNEAVPLSDMIPDYRDVLNSYIPWIMIAGNKLWIGNGYIYDIETGVMEKNSLSKFQILNKPIIDRLGNIWLNNYDGFVKYNRSSNEMFYLKTKVCQGFTFSDNYIWGINSNSELLRMSISSGDIINNNIALPRWVVNDIALLHAINDTAIFIGTRSKGLWLFDVSTSSIRQLFQENYIRNILTYNPSTYWIATENGIYVYRLDTDEVIHWEKDPLDSYAIQDHAIYTFFKDREGGIWCGSYFRGLSYVPNSQLKFSSYKPSKTYNGFKGTVVREFCSDSKGNIWMGTEDCGINCFIPEESRFINFSKDSGLGTNNIHGLCIDGDLLWCGSFDNGIELFDVNSRKITHSFKANDGRSNLSSDFVFTILKNRNGDIWIGTYAGVQIYDRTANRFTDKLDGIGLCSHLMQDSRNNVWAVSSNRLVRISEDRKLTEFHIPRGTIQSVMESQNNEIWVATSVGISCLDIDKGIFVNHTLSEQDSSTNFAFRIEEDIHGYFWISTGHGLVRYHPDTHSSYVFTSIEGLPEDRFNQASSFKANDGTLYFGTINGFTSFKPEIPTDERIKPIPEISRLTCMGVNMERTVYNINKDINYIDYTENTITFEFSSLTYTAPDALLCRYRLEPVDKNWHVQQGFSPFTYPSLSPGQYTIRFQTKDYNGEWADNEIAYRLEIVPPFYLSIWAKSLYVILLLIALIAFVRRLIKIQKNKHAQHIQDVKRATEKDLYNTKINFFTTIVHEIRTPLTLIKAPLEKEIEKNKSENLQLVEKNVERLQNLCNQLLDFRKMESDHMQLNFVKTNLSDFLKGILYRFSAQIIENKLKCEDNLDKINVEAPVDREAFTKIVSNMMSNAVKYADSIIKVNLGITENDFYLMISNDGVVINKEDKSKVFNMFYRTANAETKQGTGIGLAFCRSLAEMHNGTLEIVDSKEYTCFKLTLPLKQQIVFSIESVTDTDGIVDTSILELSDNFKATILVVEDEPELRNFLKKSLSEMYNVIVAPNGLNAMEIIEKIPVSLVVTDVMMPKMDGCELCRAIKSRIELCGIPVVMLTAKNTVEAKLEGYMVGAEEYIEKPFSIKYLIARIASIIEKKKKEAESNLTSNISVKISNVSNSSDAALVERFRKLVEENISSDKLNITFLCEQMGMSQTTFFRKMKSVLNVSPNDYIRIARIERAAAVLLEVENVRISDVAYEFGFSSPSYFTRCFMQHYGVSPKDYILHKGKLDN